MSYWVTIYRFAWGLLLVLLAILMVCIFLPKCNSLRELQKEIVRLQDENSKTKSHINDRRVKQERFSSDTNYVERIARDIGYMKEKEVLFVFTNEQSGARSEKPK